MYKILEEIYIDVEILQLINNYHEGGYNHRGLDEIEFKITNR